MELNKNRILIVDDEKPLRLGLMKIVEAAGFEPFEAENGREALRQVQEHCPALMILDVMMEDMSGLEVCRIIKNDPETRGIKIVKINTCIQQNNSMAERSLDLVHLRFGFFYSKGCTSQDTGTCERRF